MGGQAAVDVELRITARDGGTQTTLSAIQGAAEKTAAAATTAAQKSAQAVEEASTRSAEAAKGAALKSVQAVQAQHDSHIEKYRAIASARETLGIRSEQAVRGEITKTQEAYRTLASSGTASAQELARAQDATINKVRTLRQELGEVSRLQRLTQAAQVGGAVVAGGVAAKTVIDIPVKSYADLESAQADLRIAMMTQGGKVSAAYGEIMRQATELGNNLPGATKDFVAAAAALKEQGMTDKAVTGGGLKAAANFGVLAQMNQYQSATTIAKMREAYGLGDAELPAMANLMQKARYAYGIHPDDFRAVAQYAAPTYNTLKLTGAENAKKLLAVQGMAASVGLENTSFGTNFAQMLGRTAMIDFKLGGKGQEAKEAREALSAHGIKMNFFDAKGQFAGIEAMFAELDKLKPLKDVDRMHVLHALFGVEAARPASIMIEKGGLAAYKEALARLDAQASMDERIATKTSTLAAKEEALAGTWENVKAGAGKGYGNVRKSGIDAANDALGWVQGQVDKNPGWGTAAVTGLAGATGVAATYGTLKALQTVMGTGAGMRAVASIPGITTAAKVMSKLPVAPKGPGLAGIAASAGGALLSTVYGEESKAARYGSAALSGAGLGATIGSMIPVVGTAIGAGVGGLAGVLVQAIAELRKPQPPQPPTAMKADITVGLAPGLVLQNQRTQTNGPGAVRLNTGNIHTGAPW